MPRPAVVLPLLAISSLLVGAAPGRALTAVCTANWQAASGGTSTGTLTGATPVCPPSTITASVTVGSGANAGTINGGDAITGTGTNQFTRTVASSVDLGDNPGVTENLTLTFSQAVTNPYLFFTYLDAGTSFTFTQPFVLAQQPSNASVSGQTVSGTGGSNTVNDGFVVQMQGTYSVINFSYTDTTTGVQSVAFTAGANFVPAPLPLMGAGVAFSFSRRMRRRIQGRV